MDPQTPPAAVEDRWRSLLADAEAIAEEYEADGTDTVVVHPGDVTPLDGTPFGFDVLAPRDEFDALEALAADATFDTSHVYRAETDAARVFVVVVEGALEAADGGDATDVAVVVPAFLSLERAPSLESRARREGVMYTHVRPVSDDARVTFTHDDPDLFF